MQCQKCRSPNPETARYCNQCGIFLDSVIPPSLPLQSFEEKFEKIQRYLPQGLSEKILTQRDRIEGERKHVTVMFCDMEGFMPLVERLGPESAYTIMDKVYEILIQQVNDFEGTVNEMTGDGIMALFGAPIALEEAPQRALWAAHAIHREMAAFNQKNKGLEPIRMRIGVHAGPVVVGTLGNDLRVDFKAVGDTVNLASRMEQLAKPGTTYATREVFKLARGMFAFENLGPKVIKGRDESIPVYRVHTRSTNVYRPRPGSERMIFSAMVGRDDKLDKLDLQLRKLIAGTGGIINIIGEAGIGKSRLLAELKTREVVRQVTLFEGCAVSMGRNLSFHPIIDLLKQWARIKVDHEADEAFVRLEAAIRKLFGHQTLDVLPFIATLMGMNLPALYQKRLQGIEGEALEKLIQKNLRALLIRLSAARPLVIVIDDLHWSDESSIELLESLFRLAASERILFLNLFRPGYVGTGERILESSKTNPSAAQVDILLEPLDAHRSEKLIVNMLDLQGPSHAVVGQIVRRASGNPYFIEEVVRSFIDEGAVVVRGGKFEVTPKFSNVTIPNTIRDVLMARIDRLEEETRNLLKVAAVIGRSFFYRILSDVAGTVQNLDKRLDYLKEIQMIRERRRLEELEYLFNHALAQEAAYASILPQKRKALHLKVADTIQIIFAEKLHAFYGMLAYHYSRAENLDKAEAALIKAGEEALKTSASSEALHYYQEALRLYRRKTGDAADAEKVARLEKSIALALFNRGQYEASVEYFDKALEFYWGHTSRHPVTRPLRFGYNCCHFLVAVYLPFLKFNKIATDRDREAIELCYKKCQALITFDARRFFMESFHLYRKLNQFDLSGLENGVGKFISASALFTFSGVSFRLGRRILDIANGQLNEEDARQLITLDLLQTTLNYFAGNWDDIDPHDDDLVNRNLDLGEIWSASMHYYWHGFYTLYRGDLGMAKLLVGRLRKLSEVYDNKFSQLLEKLLQASLLMECRRFPDALDEIENGVELSQRANAGLAAIHFLGCKAQIFILMQDREAAQKLMAQCTELRGEHNPAPWEMSAFMRSQAVLDLFCLQEETLDGQKPSTLKYRQRALHSCRTFLRQTRKVAQHRTEACRYLGKFYGVIHKPQKAQKWWRKSIREGRQLGARLELARTYLEVGQSLLDTENPDAMLDGIKAPDYLKKGRDLFEQMGLEWELDRRGRLATN